MLNPRIIYMAEWSDITPWLATACKIPRDADDDWSKAVTPVPAKTPKIGLSNFVIKLANPG